MEFSTAQMDVRELLTILCLLAIEALPIRDELPPVGAILEVSARHVQLFGGKVVRTFAPFHGPVSRSAASSLSL
jgi:hypothetical protein